MKYTYAYKTSDGVRHVEAMEAESRGAVFAALREKGIKAIKVVAADGSKDNGEIRGGRLRTVIAVGVIAAVLGFLLGLTVMGVFSPIENLLFPKRNIDMNEYTLMIVSSICSLAVTAAGLNSKNKIWFRILLAVSCIGMISSSIMWYRDKVDGAEDKLRIVKQGEIIDFLRMAAPLPQRKLPLVRKIVEGNMYRVVHTHYGWSDYSQEDEELRYVFTDGAKTNFLGAIVLKREALEEIIRSPYDDQTMQDVFQRLLAKTLVEVSGKTGIPLESDIIDSVHSLARAMLPTERFGYDRANRERYVWFNYYNSPDESREVVLTKDEVDKLAQCSLYCASIRLYRILLSKGIDCLKLIPLKSPKNWFSLNV